MFEIQKNKVIKNFYNNHKRKDKKMRRKIFTKRGFMKGSTNIKLTGFWDRIHNTSFSS